MNFRAVDGDKITNIKNISLEIDSNVVHIRVVAFFDFKKKVFYIF
ncbi:hypothetical protein THOM_0285 [Trachipleistophora hominis]|uniref:Uncharacterized protein n=1 Tax=Trachipleistophora hominis TaxID=72359 RepID=L7K063_TRAHO|nr:hypothetical protein THOM_0285 [Trachipleistophora hominis]